MWALVEDLNVFYIFPSLERILAIDLRADGDIEVLRRKLRIPTSFLHSAHTPSRRMKISKLSNWPDFQGLGAPLRRAYHRIPIVTRPEMFPTLSVTSWPNHRPESKSNFENAHSQPLPYVTLTYVATTFPRWPLAAWKIFPVVWTGAHWSWRGSILDKKFAATFRLKHGTVTKMVSPALACIRS